MGQAKQRGTPEERIEQGVQAAAERERQRLERIERYERNMTPAQREQRRKARTWMAVALGITASNLSNLSR